MKITLRLLSDTTHWSKANYFVKDIMAIELHNLVDSICGAMTTELHDLQHLFCDHRLYSFGSM